MKNLPTLPNATGLQVGADRVLIFLEPLPMKIPTKILTTERQKQQFIEDIQNDMHKRRLQVGSLRKGVVLSVPVNLDKEQFPYEVGSVVGVPNETNSYEVINIDRSPCYIIGTRDVRMIFSQLSPEEIEKWNKQQEDYINDVVFPVNELDQPGPRIKPGGKLEGFKQ